MSWDDRRIPNEENIAEHDLVILVADNQSNVYLGTILRDIPMQYNAHVYQVNINAQMIGGTAQDLHGSPYGHRVYVSKEYLKLANEWRREDDH